MNDLQSVITQLHHVGAQAAGQSVRNDAVSGNFSQVFASALDSMSHYQDIAANQAKSVELGDGQVGINDLMLSVQKATISLQLGVQVRNKMIAAYNEIMNMSV